jgi:hypothetical protein
MDPLTAALAGLGTGDDQHPNTHSKQQSGMQHPQEQQALPQLQQQQQNAGGVAHSNGSAAAVADGLDAAGNHSRNPSSLSIDPLSAAIDDDGGIAEDEQSDKLSPLSSPGAAEAEAAAAEAAAGIAGGSGNGSSNSSGSGSVSRPIPVRMPPLADPDLNPEELGQLLQKVRGCMASALSSTALCCCATITLQRVPHCNTCKALASTLVALFDSATPSTPCGQSVLGLLLCVVLLLAGKSRHQ